MAIMAITTKSSISVKPRSSFIPYPLRIQVFLLIPRQRMSCTIFFAVALPAVLPLMFRPHVEAGFIRYRRHAGSYGRRRGEGVRQGVPDRVRRYRWFRTNEVRRPDRC